VVFNQENEILRTFMKRLLFLLTAFTCTFALENRAFSTEKKETGHHEKTQNQERNEKKNNKENKEKKKR
jgi:hypothetical protein